MGSPPEAVFLYAVMSLSQNHSLTGTSVSVSEQDTVVDMFGVPESPTHFSMWRWVGWWVTGGGCYPPPFGARFEVVF